MKQNDSKDFRDLIAPLSNPESTSSGASPLVQPTGLTSQPPGNPQEGGQWAPIGSAPSAPPPAPASTEAVSASGVVPRAARGPEGISSNEVARALSPPQSAAPASGIFGLNIRTETPGKLLGEAVPDDGGYVSYRAPDGNLLPTDNSKHMLQQNPQSGKLQVFEKIAGTRPATAGDLAQIALDIAKHIPFVGSAIELPGAADDFWSGKPGAFSHMSGVLGGLYTPGWRPNVVRSGPAATIERPGPAGEIRDPALPNPEPGSFSIVDWSG